MKFIQKCITNRSLLYINRCISSISDSNNKQLYHILGTKYNIRGISTVHKERSVKVETEVSDYNYVKIKEGDLRFGQQILSAKTKKGRDKCGLCLLEGKRLINDAVNAGVTIASIFFTHKSLLQYIHVPEGSELYKVDNRHMKLWSDVNHTSGLMALAQIPDTVDLDYEALPISLILDQIRDPGNMGTLLRTALAAGCHQVITTKGCCNVWDAKVLRAAMGAHFHLPMATSVPWSSIENLTSRDPKHGDIEPKDTPVFLATNQSEDAKPSKKLIASLSDPYHERPFTERIESSSGISSLRYIDPAYDDESHCALYRQAPLDCKPYHTANFSSKGGETEGVSDQARRMTFEGKGHAVNVPMSKSTESLNSSIAAGVILFEMKRQLTIVK